MKFTFPNISIFNNMSDDMGIDLGTANTLVHCKDKGIIIREPSVVAVEKDTNEVLAIGAEAKRMIGRTPGNIVAIRPMKDGVIADYEITQSMLKYFIKQAMGNRTFVRPRILVGVPSGVTEVEKRAVIDATIEAGAREAYLIEEPMAAAIGAGMPVQEATGSMVVDIGGGTTDIAVISLGGIVLSDSLRIAGDKFDDAIVDYVKKEFNLMIGERTAENIKMEVGAAFADARRARMNIRGRDLLTGLPKNIEVATEQISEALNPSVTQIVERVKNVLEKCPPELASDIMDHGIILTGGGAMLYGLDELIRRETQISTSLAEDPLSCVALGTGKALENIDKLENKNAISFWK